MDRLLLFGGSFNPIHHGHLVVARHVAEQLDVARILLIPSATPPHKQDRKLAETAHRLALCRLAVAGDEHFAVSDWEARQAGPNYTLHTVQHFTAAAGAAGEVCWLVGMDSLHELHTWHRAGELVDACRIVTAARPGRDVPDRRTLVKRFNEPRADKLLQDVLETPRIDISSTDIRRRIQQGRSIRYLVPPAVAAYVAEHALYSAG